MNLKVHRDMYTFIGQLKNRSFKFGATVEPKDFNTDEKSLELKHDSKY